MQTGIGKQAEQEYDYQLAIKYVLFHYCVVHAMLDMDEEEDESIAWPVAYHMIHPAGAGRKFASLQTGASLMDCIKELDDQENEIFFAVLCAILKVTENKEFMSLENYENLWETLSEISDSFYSVPSDEKLEQIYTETPDIYDNYTGDPQIKHYIEVLLDDSDSSLSE